MKNSLKEVEGVESPPRVAPVSQQNEGARDPNQTLFTFAQDGEKGQWLDLQDRRKKAVLNQNDSPNPSTWFFQVANGVQTWWAQTSLQAYDPLTDAGTLRSLSLREGKRTGEKMVALTVSGNPDFMINRSEIEGFKRSILTTLSGETPSLFLRIQKAGQKEERAFYEIHLGGPDCLTEILLIQGKPLTFKMSPGSFLGPHPFQLEKWYGQALILTQPQPTDTVLDLYAGIGALSILFSSHVQRIFAVEESAYALCDAERNIKDNHLSNISLFKGEALTVLSHFNSPVDLVILSPPGSKIPRSVLERLLNLAPKKILYFVDRSEIRDNAIVSFKEGGYEVTQSSQSIHLSKNIAVLEKRGMRYTGIR